MSADAIDPGALSGLISRYANRAAAATDPAVTLELAATLAREVVELRDHLAVALVLGGASFAEIGRRLQITRQAAHDAYATRVQAEMHRRIHHH